eukprot:scaffold8964_cov54-Phaeocystis_antarctica.AAC.2
MLRIHLSTAPAARSAAQPPLETKRRRRLPLLPFAAPRGLARRRHRRAAATVHTHDLGRDHGPCRRGALGGGRRRGRRRRGRRRRGRRRRRGLRCGRGGGADALRERHLAHNVQQRVGERLVRVGVGVRIRVRIRVRVMMCQQRVGERLPPDARAVGQLDEAVGVRGVDGGEGDAPLEVERGEAELQRAQQLAELAWVRVEVRVRVRVRVRVSAAACGTRLAPAARAARAATTWAAAAPGQG